MKDQVHYINEVEAYSLLVANTCGDLREEFNSARLLELKHYAEKMNTAITLYQHLQGNNDGCRDQTGT